MASHMPPNDLIWPSNDPQTTLKWPQMKFVTLLFKHILRFFQTFLRFCLNFFDILISILDLDFQIWDFRFWICSRILRFSDFEMFFLDIFWSFQYFVIAFERDDSQYFSTLKKVHDIFHFYSWFCDTRTYILTYIQTYT